MSASALRRGASAAVVVAAGLLALAVAPPGALAHERVTVGNYLFVIGWRDEPALVGMKNALDLRIYNVSTGNQVPVPNATTDLRARFLYGSQAMDAGLLPVFGEPGAYTADIIPTAPGVYRVGFSGRVENQPVNFTQELDEVAWPSSLEFPTPRPTPENLSGALGGAQAMAAYGIALGAVGTGLGAVALAVAFLSRRRHREG